VGTGECQHVLNAQGDVWVVTYSPQGHQVASADMSGTLMLWDTETGACQHVLTGHTSIIEQIVYSPNGKRIASCSWDKTVRLWDVQAGLCSRILIGHQVDVRRIDYSPRGNQVASACYDTVRLWDTESGECCCTLINHKKDISAIAYSPRGDLIASWSEKGEARLWDVETGECCWTRDYEVATPPMGYSNLAFNFVWMSLDVDSFVAGGHDGSLRAFDVVGEGDQRRVRMRWGSAMDQLAVEDACIQDVQGLGDPNKRLLKQRGAIGEPAL
jgi:WD40 repeat protein